MDRRRPRAGAGRTGGSAEQDEYAEEGYDDQEFDDRFAEEDTYGEGRRAARTRGLRTDVAGAGPGARPRRDRGVRPRPADRTGAAAARRRAVPRRDEEQAASRRGRTNSGRAVRAGPAGTTRNRRTSPHAAFEAGPQGRTTRPGTRSTPVRRMNRRTLSSPVRRPPGGRAVARGLPAAGPRGRRRLPAAAPGRRARLPARPAAAPRRRAAHAFQAGQPHHDDEPAHAAFQPPRHDDEHAFQPAGRPARQDGRAPFPAAPA